MMTAPAKAKPSEIPKIPPIPPKPQPPAEKVGTCVACGSDALEWVTGTRKKDHQPFAAFKCQQCKTWQPEAKK